MSVRRPGIAYRVLGALHAAGLARPLHHWLMRDVISVVLYHGIVDRSLAVPGPCFMPLERFAQQMEYLSRHFEVMHLEEAFDPARPRSSRPIACVTFDDGFATLHDLALPVLERFRIPATVYLVTDLVGTEERLWYTRLHQAIAETTATEIDLGGVRYLLGGPGERCASSSAMQEALKDLPRARFAGAFQDLLDRLGATARASAPWPSTRMLDREQILRMARNDLVRFGSHTASHQILTRTDPQQAREEILRSVKAVATMVERPSRTFAYPNGGQCDFDENAIAALKEAGVAYAATTIEGPNPRDVDPYRIRRYLVSALHHPARFAYKFLHTRALLEKLRRRRGVQEAAR